MGPKRSAQERGAPNDGDHKPVGAATRASRTSKWTWVWFTVVILVVGAAIVWQAKRWYMPSVVPDMGRAERRWHAFHLYEQGQFEQAVKAYEVVLGEQDDDATRINYGNALKKLGRADDAEAQYRRVLARDPRNATAWFNLGNSLRDARHDTRGAVEAFRHATEIDPNMAVADFSLGAALIDLGDYEAAIAALQSALQLAPENVSWRKDAENALTLAHVRDAEKKGQLHPPSHK